MITGSYNTERDKYAYLLNLANEQIKALQTNDIFGFERIIKAKTAITQSLSNPRLLLASDPSLQTIILRIQECDRVAEKLLYRRIGRLRREMSEIQQFQLARRAYGRAGVKRNPIMGLSIDENTPRYLDFKS